MKAIFTVEMLIDAKACLGQVKLFRETFGESVNVTVSRARKVAGKFDWDFARRFLDDEGRAAYNAATVSAWAAYDAATVSARAAYGAATAPAWASAYIATVARRQAGQVPA